jgi:hypothetical protein
MAQVESCCHPDLPPRHHARNDPASRTPSPQLVLALALTSPRPHSHDLSLGSACGGWVVQVDFNNALEYNKLDAKVVQDGDDLLMTSARWRSNPMHVEPNGL